MIAFNVGEQVPIETAAGPLKVRILSCRQYIEYTAMVRAAREASDEQWIDLATKAMRTIVAEEVATIDALADRLTARQFGELLVRCLEAQSPSDDDSKKSPSPSP